MPVEYFHEVLLFLPNCSALALRHIKWFFCFSFVLYSYTLQWQRKPGFGKESLKFEWEVCRLGKNEAVGIRRQRLRGDAWVHRRLAEDILSFSCHVWLLLRKPQCCTEALIITLENSVWKCNLWSPSQLCLRNLVSSDSSNHPLCVNAHCTFPFLTRTVNFCYTFCSCNSSEIKFLKLPPSSTAPFFIAAMKRKLLVLICWGSFMVRFQLSSRCGPEVHLHISLLVSSV